ncbi:MAG: hypothetical protein M3Y49_06440 [Actinomycetota bacterium]|nr:hypothetical protein [Actinomycetota bacterium]
MPRVYDRHRQTGQNGHAAAVSGEVRFGEIVDEVPVVDDVAGVGAGVIVRKNYFERGAGGGWMPMMPAGLQQSWVSGSVPPRWVLVVKDIGGKDHVVAVTGEVWHSYGERDLITADDPLVDID